MAAQPTFVSFNRAEAASSDVACTFAPADGFLVTATLGASTVVHLAEGGTVNVGAPTIGTFIPLRCNKVVFASGSLIFVQAN